MYDSDDLLAFGRALADCCLVLIISIVYSDVALAVGAWAKARLCHLHFNSAVRGLNLRFYPALRRSSRCTSWLGGLIPVLPTDLAPLQVHSFGEEKAELFTALLRVELALSQADLLNR